MPGLSDFKGCTNTRYKAKKIYIEIVSFPTDILPSLVIVKEPEGVAQACSAKKLILKNFSKFTGKHVYQSLLFVVKHNME